MEGSGSKSYLTQTSVSARPETYESGILGPTVTKSSSGTQQNFRIITVQFIFIGLPYSVQIITVLHQLNIWVTLKLCMVV
jgi:hypothetical protein